MPQKALSREDAQKAVDAWRDNNYSSTDAARVLGVPESTFRNRLKTAKNYGLVSSTNHLESLKKQDPTFLKEYKQDYIGRLALSVETGHVLIASDCHYWPNVITTAHKAFVKLCRDLKPKAVIMNGDVFDGANISRFPSIGWEQKPQVVEELEACRDRLDEIQAAIPNAKKIWTLGNHDARFETRLANNAPEYARVHGVHLKDHFPRWTPCWATWINEHTVVKHRFKGGIHATHNNTLWAGKSIITGHLHSLKVTPLTDYNGTRYGIDTGTLASADPVGPQFVNYLEDNPVNWRSGFVVLTFHKGKLLWPEVCAVINQKTVEFRGQILRV